ncbi:MAG: hypothetical protein A3E38_01705 [Candidatus Moranbacteria bacterium RIFCSPHIGHO2_12_FULL_54_9]|nr:MAG: hypothetical protein A3E38_01705 [Candidatus Moranbacteria bacterium RIFCSPHIGHO2_12_FULL_54_9]
MGIERAFSRVERGIDKERQSSEYLHPLIIEAEKKTRTIIERDAIDPESFIDPYEESAVRADIALAEKLRAKYETDEPHKKYADVMEGILYEQIELSNWFGEKAQTIKTSFYDDYVNHVDLIVEFEEASKTFSHLGLAIDVTFGTTAMYEKFEKIREEITNGKLTEVKYFESANSRHKGIYKKLPRVVIGVEREHIIELAGIWLDPKRKNEFAKHPIQKVILEEIASQLDQFRIFSKMVRQDDLVVIFERELSVVRKILAEKQDIHAEEYTDDRVMGAIQQQLKLF